MQMGPQSLSEGSLYHGKYWCFFFFFVPSTFREMMPAAVAVGNPLRGYEMVYSAGLAL